MFTAHSLMTKAGNWLFLAGLFLLPTMLGFSLLVPIAPVKMVIASVALIGSLVSIVFGVFKRGAVSLPLSALIWSVWLIPLTALISSLLGPSFMWSVIGGALDMDTVYFMSLLALAVSLPFALFDKPGDYMRACSVLLVAAFAVALFHLARLFFGADTLSFGLMTNQLFSPLGKWNDVGIFFGLTALLSLVSLETMRLTGLHRGVVGALLAVSLFFVALVNFLPVWVVLGVISFGVVLSKFVLAPGARDRFSAASTVVFIIAILAVLFTNSLGTKLGVAFSVQQIEARPSWDSTLTVGQAVLRAHPLTGSGPNTFILDWDAHRPQEINQSIFWNADFTSGVGMLPTSVITTGIVGTLAWLLFIALFLIAGVRGLVLRTPQDQGMYHLMLATFTGGLYILIMSAVYLPSAQLMIIGFVIIGMFAALYHGESGAKALHIDFRERPRLGFVAVLGLALVLVTSILSAYGIGTAFAAAVQFERASQAAQVAGDVDLADQALTKAISLFPQDQYYRLGVLVHLAKLSKILNEAPTATSQTDAQQRFQQELGAAVESGLSATRLNTENYRNWATLGTAYQSVVPLNIDGSYDAAINAFTRARALNPSMPTLPMALAQLDVTKGKLESARALVQEAVALKQDYTPGLTLLAQLELQRGDLPEAIKRAEAAAVFEPSNPVMHFQVGVLKFENKDYKGAQQAFVNAVGLAQDYANARYYLGRTYLKLNNSAGALEQFESVRVSNPENTEVQAIIAALQAGKDPFAPVPTKK